MDFIAQYGLFLLKTLTLLSAGLFFIMSVFAITKKTKSKLEITSLSNDYRELTNYIAHEIHGTKKGKRTKKELKTFKQRPSLYVLDFNGDIKASQTEQLRQEITAVLSIIKDRDEIMIRLESPGGAVNGYGLAASQLQRIRDKNIPLTVCIDKVAASGGYLMSCVADTIVAAPFAIIGSIGVVAQLPNFHRWLKKNNVDVELFTAGEYKRTVTLLGENTEKGKRKFQEDLEKIHQTFRNYVLIHRPEIDIEAVSTGEHWLASDAFSLKLVDELKTSDDYIIDKMARFQIYKFNVHSKKSLADKILKPAMKMLQMWS